MSFDWIRQFGNRQVLIPLLVLGLIFVVSGSLISQRVDVAIQSYQDAYLSLSANLLQERFNKMAEAHRNQLKVLAIRPEVGEGQFVIKAEGNTRPLGKLLEQEMRSARAEHIRAVDNKGQVLVQYGQTAFDPAQQMASLLESLRSHPPIKDPQTQLDEVVHSRLFHADGRFYLLTVAPLLDVEDIVGVIILVHSLGDTALSALRAEMSEHYFSGSSQFQFSLATRQGVVHSTFDGSVALVFPPTFPLPFDQAIGERAFRHIPVAIEKTPFYLILSSDSSLLGGLHRVIRLILTGVFVTVLVLLVIIVIFNVRQLYMQQHARDLAEREARFRRLADAALEGIVFSEEGRIVDVNQALTEMFAAPAETLTGTELRQLFVSQQQQTLAELLALRSTASHELLCQRSDGSSFISEVRSRRLEEFGRSVLVTAIRDISARKEAEERLRAAKEQAERDFVELQALDQQKTALNAQLNQTLEEVRAANQRIMESIRYAERIQRSLLPRVGHLQECLPNSFFQWRPRDVVSGDLVFLHQGEAGRVVVLMDCTGHGVPGALMTMVAHSTLHRIIANEGCLDDPGEILRRLGQRIKEQIHQDEDAFFTDVGLDCGICFLPQDGQQLFFAGAHIDLYLASAAGNRIIRGNMASIGYRRSAGEYAFVNHCVPLQPETICYMFSDGLHDQLGGPHHIPFGKKRLLACIDALRDDPVSQHGEAILQAVEAYRGECEWKDDVTLIGFQLANL
ncbi:MAG: SpoIIE family protein phosphatase [Magnetococcus sp. YQC-3]